MLKILGGGLAGMLMPWGKAKLLGSELLTYQKNWNQLQQQSLKILEKMPEADYGYFPAKGMQTFGELFVECCYQSSFLIRSFIGQDHMAKPPHFNKEICLTYTEDFYGMGGQILKALSENDLEKVGIRKGDSYTFLHGRDYILQSIGIMERCHGTAITYLKMKGLDISSI